MKVKFPFKLKTSGETLLMRRVDRFRLIYTELINFRFFIKLYECFYSENGIIVRKVWKIWFMFQNLRLTEYEVSIENLNISRKYRKHLRYTFVVLNLAQSSWFLRIFEKSLLKKFTPKKRFEIATTYLITCKLHFRHLKSVSVNLKQKIFSPNVLYHALEGFKVELINGINPETII